jgi:glucokinase
MLLEPGDLLHPIISWKKTVIVGTTTNLKVNMSSSPECSRVLAGDIGGTKTMLALFEVPASPKSPLREIRRERFRSADFPGLEAILSSFLRDDETSSLAAAVFGIPGAVKDGFVHPTNLGWGVRQQAIEDLLGVRAVRLLNDLAANAWGIAELHADDFAVVLEGSPPAVGNRCVVSPGTGLGQAGLFWDGISHHVWACEGGHTDFAPRDDMQIELLRFLYRNLPHVSEEHVVSGIGIANIYRFLRETGRGDELSEVAEAMKQEEAGAVVSRFAADGRCPMCVETLEIFLSCLASECANTALKCMATGGVYLGGGIPVKLLSRLQTESFREGFLSKGRSRALMESIPVRVILNDSAALFGAARRAIELAAGRWHG